MALKATIYKATLQIADLSRQYYQDHSFTIARHPSETDVRMMVRLLVFALRANANLVFTKGISTDTEPDLWEVNMDTSIEQWIDIGQPDEKRIRRACGRAKHAVIYCYSGSSAEIWWEQNQQKCSRFDNLSVFNLAAPACQALAAMAQRTMQLQFTIDEHTCWVSDGQHSVAVETQLWFPPT